MRLRLRGAGLPTAGVVGVSQTTTVSRAVSDDPSGCRATSSTPHLPDRGFGCELRFGSQQVEYPNQNVRAFNELALFRKPKGKTVLPNDELGRGNQRLKSIIRPHDIGSADNSYRDLKDGCEDYGERVEDRNISRYNLLECTLPSRLNQDQ